MGGAAVVLLCCSKILPLSSGVQRRRKILALLRKSVARRSDRSNFFCPLQFYHTFFTKKKKNEPFSVRRTAVLLFLVQTTRSKIYQNGPRPELWKETLVKLSSFLIICPVQWVWAQENFFFSEGLFETSFKLVFWNTLKKRSREKSKASLKSFHPSDP